MVIDEQSLQTISSRLRNPLERICLTGIDEWNPIFSNGYGFGSDKLVIRMKPVHDIDTDIIGIDTNHILEVLRIMIGDICSIEDLEVVQRDGCTGFFIVVDLNELI